MTNNTSSIIIVAAQTNA